MKSFKQFLEEKNDLIYEMTIKFRNYDDERQNTKNFNKKQFEATKYLPTIENHLQPINCKTHIYKDGNNTEYYTNNHKTKENLHRAYYLLNEPSDQVKVPHIQQWKVDRNPDTNKLPKGYATDFAYERFKEQEHPFVTSNYQYEAGHRLWRRLADKALSDNHNVYYHDGKKLHKSDNKKIENHFHDSYGNQAKHIHSKMIISKRPL